MTGQNIQVTTNVLPQNEPTIAVNPLNSENLLVGANDPSPGFDWLGTYSSTDGGASWTRGLIPVTGVLAGFDAASDPSVVFDGSGNVYYAGLAFNIQSGTPVNGSVFVSKSTDGGVSFSQTTLVSAESSRVFNDKPLVTVDSSTGKLFVSWTRFTSSRGDIMVSYSSNGGLSFSTPLRVSTSALNQGSVPVVGPSGVFVVWNDLANHRIVTARSTNGGVSFSAPTVVSSYVPLPSPFSNSRFRTNNNPAATVDSTNGNVYVSWADYRRGNADIFFSRSTNNGASWTPPLRVNDDNSTSDQFFPWMASSSGQLNIVFYDRRLDSNNHLMDVFSAQSIDHGSSFTTNIRVSDVSSNPDAVLFGNGESFIGDYIGVASHGGKAYSAWTDMRDVTVSSPEDENIFAEVPVPNIPPTLNPIGNKTVDEETTLTFQVRASDPDQNETLTVTAEGLPLGANFSSIPSTNGAVTGTFTWTPREEQGPGNYTAQIIASDGFSSPSLNLSISVNEVNRSPVLRLPRPETVNEGSTLAFTVSATDPDVPANRITLSCDTCASIGVAFDPSTGYFDWTPTEAHGPGDYGIVFTGSDNGVPPLSDTQTLLVHVDEVNLPPSLEPIPVQTIDEEITLTFQALATDPDIPVQHLFFSLGQDAPTGAAMSDSGLFSWIPAENQGPATYNFTIAVSDGSLTSSETVIVIVDEVDNPPVLTVPGPQTLEQGQTLNFTVHAADPNVNVSNKPISTIILSASGLPEGAVFDPNTGKFTWRISDTQQPGVYKIEFAAIENGGGKLSETASVTVTVARHSSSNTRFLAELMIWSGALLVISILATGSLALVLIWWKRNRKESSAQELRN